MKSRQELLSQIADHLMEQYEQSTDNGNECAYRGFGGLKCAIGCLIPDDAYDERIEGIAVNALYDESQIHRFTIDVETLALYKTILRKSEINTASIKTLRMLNDLQSIHDRVDPCCWSSSIKETAIEYGLKYEES